MLNKENRTTGIKVVTNSNVENMLMKLTGWQLSPRF
jgi:hypothetical protein